MIIHLPFLSHKLWPRLTYRKTENERLPFELGWVKNADITLADVTNMTTTLGAEVSLFCNGTGAGTPVAATDSNTRRGLHGNLY